MTEDNLRVERLSKALNGYAEVDPEISELVDLAGVLSRALHIAPLSDAERVRIYESASRLIQGAGRAHMRRILRGVHVGRQRGALLGGVVAGALAAGVGYVVIHERRTHAGGRVARAGAIA